MLHSMADTLESVGEEKMSDNSPIRYKLYMRAFREDKVAIWIATTDKTPDSISEVSYVSTWNKIIEPDFGWYDKLTGQTFQSRLKKAREEAISRADVMNETNNAFQEYNDDTNFGILKKIRKASDKEAVHEPTLEEQDGH